MNWGFCDCASICGHQRSRVCLMKFTFLWRNHTDSKGRKSDNTDHSSMITQGTVAAKKALTATMQGVVFSDLQKRTRSWVFLRFQGKKKCPNLMACLVDCFIMMHLGFSWFSIDLFRLGLIVLKGPAHQEPVFSVMRAFSNGRPGVRPPKFRQKKNKNWRRISVTNHHESLTLFFSQDAMHVFKSSNWLLSFAMWVPDMIHLELQTFKTQIWRRLEEHSTSSCDKCEDCWGSWPRPEAAKPMALFPRRPGDWNSTRWRTKNMKKL